MDDMNFIRQQVRRILTEEKKERGISGGKGFEEVKEQVAFATKNPGAVMERFGVKGYTPPGVSDPAKAYALIQRIKGLSLNSEDFMLAVKDAEISGNILKVYPSKHEVGETERPVVPTSKLGHYIKAILVAANGSGILKYDPKESPMRHLSGEYVTVTLK